MATDLDRLKHDAAAEALRSVQSGMLLGLGTGSTAAIFVTLLGEAIAQGALRDIRAVCTSNATEELARRVDIPLVEFASIDEIDLAIDGADEIDEQLRLIKGRGGALLREKIVEQAAREFIVIADETKVVSQLGVGTFPVEVVRFASERLQRRLTVEGIACSYRRTSSGELLVTDEQHHILDLMLPQGRTIPELHEELKRRAGVVETGFFGHEATLALIAARDGVITMRRPSSPR